MSAFVKGVSGGGTSDEKVLTGSFTGNGSATLSIPCPFTPKQIFVINTRAANSSNIVYAYWANFETDSGIEIIRTTSMGIEIAFNFNYSDGAINLTTENGRYVWYDKFTYEYVITG